MAKRKGRARGGGDDGAGLVGQRILVKWEVPDAGPHASEALFIGTVMTHDADKARGFCPPCMTYNAGGTWDVMCSHDPGEGFLEARCAICLLR